MLTERERRIYVNYYYECLNILTVNDEFIEFKFRNIYFTVYRNMYGELLISKKDNVLAENIDTVEKFLDFLNLYC